MAWNEFSLVEESQVVKIACQHNADLFLMLMALSMAHLFLKAPQ
jgi:hypothetical protein